MPPGVLRLIAMRLEGYHLQPQNESKFCIVMGRNEEQMKGHRSGPGGMDLVMTKPLDVPCWFDQEEPLSVPLILRTPTDAYSGLSQQSNEIGRGKLLVSAPSPGDEARRQPRMQIISLGCGLSMQCSVQELSDSAKVWDARATKAEDSSSYLSSILYIIEARDLAVNHGPSPINPSSEKRWSLLVQIVPLQPDKTDHCGPDAPASMVQLPWLPPIISHPAANRNDRSSSFHLCQQPLGNLRWCEGVTLPNVAFGEKVSRKNIYELIPWSARKLCLRLSIVDADTHEAMGAFAIVNLADIVDPSVPFGENATTPASETEPLCGKQESASHKSRGDVFEDSRQTSDIWIPLFRQEPRLFRSSLMHECDEGDVVGMLRLWCGPGPRVSPSVFTNPSPSTGAPVGLPSFTAHVDFHKDDEHGEAREEDPLESTPENGGTSLVAKQELGAKPLPPFQQPPTHQSSFTDETSSTFLVALYPTPAPRDKTKSPRESEDSSGGGTPISSTFPAEPRQMVDVRTPPEEFSFEGQIFSSFAESQSAMKARTSATQPFSPSSPPCLPRIVCKRRNSWLLSLPQFSRLCSSVLPRMIDLDLENWFVIETHDESGGLSLQNGRICRSDRVRVLNDVLRACPQFINSEDVVVATGAALYSEERRVVESLERLLWAAHRLRVGRVLNRPASLQQSHATAEDPSALTGAEKETAPTFWNMSQDPTQSRSRRRCIDGATLFIPWVLFRHWWTTDLPASATVEKQMAEREQTIASLERIFLHDIGGSGDDGSPDSRGGGGLLREVQGSLAQGCSREITGRKWREMVCRALDAAGKDICSVVWKEVMGDETADSGEKAVTVRPSRVLRRECFSRLPANKTDRQPRFRRSGSRSVPTDLFRRKMRCRRETSVAIRLRIGASPAATSKFSPAVMVPCDDTSPSVVGVDATDDKCATDTPAITAPEKICAKHQVTESVVGESFSGIADIERGCCDDDRKEDSGGLPVDSLKVDSGGMISCIPANELHLGGPRMTSPTSLSSPHANLSGEKKRTSEPSWTVQTKEIDDATVPNGAVKQANARQSSTSSSSDSLVNPAPMDDRESSTDCQTGIHLAVETKTCSQVSLRSYHTDGELLRMFLEAENNELCVLSSTENILRLVNDLTDSLLACTTQGLTPLPTHGTKGRTSNFHSEDHSVTSPLDFLLGPAVGLNAAAAAHSRHPAPLPSLPHQVLPSPIVLDPPPRSLDSESGAENETCRADDRHWTDHVSRRSRSPVGRPNPMATRSVVCVETRPKRRGKAASDVVDVLVVRVHTLRKCAKNLEQTKQRIILVQRARQRALNMACSPCPMLRDHHALRDNHRWISSSLRATEGRFENTEFASFSTESKSDEPTSPSLPTSSPSNTDATGVDALKPAASPLSKGVEGPIPSLLCSLTPAYPPPRGATSITAPPLSTAVVACQNHDLAGLSEGNNVVNERAVCSYDMEPRGCRPRGRMVLETLPACSVSLTSSALHSFSSFTATDSFDRQPQPCDPTQRNDSWQRFMEKMSDLDPAIESRLLHVEGVLSQPRDSCSDGKEVQERDKGQSALQWCLGATNGTRGEKLQRDDGEVELALALFRAGVEAVILAFQRSELHAEEAARGGFFDLAGATARVWIEKGNRENGCLEGCEDISNGGSTSSKASPPVWMHVGTLFEPLDHFVLRSFSLAARAEARARQERRAEVESPRDKVVVARSQGPESIVLAADGATDGEEVVAQHASPTTVGPRTNTSVLPSHSPPKEEHAEKGFYPGSDLNEYNDTLAREVVQSVVESVLQSVSGSETNPPGAETSKCSDTDPESTASGTFPSQLPPSKLCQTGTKELDTSTTKCEDDESEVLVEDSLPPLALVLSFVFGGLRPRSEFASKELSAKKSLTTLPPVFLETIVAYRTSIQGLTLSNNKPRP